MLRLRAAARFFDQGIAGARVQTDSLFPRRACRQKQNPVTVSVAPLPVPAFTKQRHPGAGPDRPARLLHRNAGSTLPSAEGLVRSATTERHSGASAGGSTPGRHGAISAVRARRSLEVVAQRSRGPVPRVRSRKRQRTADARGPTAACSHCGSGRPPLAVIHELFPPCSFGPRHSDGRPGLQHGPDRERNGWFRPMVRSVVRKLTDGDSPEPGPGGSRGAVPQPTQGVR